LVRQPLRTVLNDSLPVQSKVIGARNSTSVARFLLGAHAHDFAPSRSRSFTVISSRTSAPLAAGVVQQHFIELRPQHLPGLRHRVLVVAIEESRTAGWLCRSARRTGRCISFGTPTASSASDQAEPLQRLKRERNHGFADVVAREFLPFQHEHAMAASRRGWRRELAPAGPPPMITAS
jgi:ribosomal protein L34